MKFHSPQSSFTCVALISTLLICDVETRAQTNVPPPDTASATNAVVAAERAERVRALCIAGRRSVCGRVIKILPEGLIVESGYTRLLSPPFNSSWHVRGGAMVERDANAFEINEPGAVCVGLVLLVDYPKRPAVKLYDYVVIQGYPAGKFEFQSVPDVKKTIRKFSGGVDTAVRLQLTE